jgi:hypothetical protein
VQETLWVLDKVIEITYTKCNLDTGKPRKVALIC